MTKNKQISLRNYVARKGLFTRLPVPYKMKSLEPEISLGRAILDRALLDSLNDPSANEWFDLDNEDFTDICYIAYLDPDEVLKCFEKTYEKLTGSLTIGDVIDE